MLITGDIILRLFIQIITEMKQLLLRRLNQVLYDFKLENSSKNWATAYNFKAVEKGQVTVEEIKYFRPSGMQGFAFNIRKDIFKNRKVRKAISYAFDFEWSNRNLFYGAYTRTKSFFDNSELSSQILPSDKELKILERYKGKIPDEVFNTVFSLPNTELEENGLRKISEQQEEF